MKKHPQHCDIRIVRRVYIFPYTLGKHTSGWFEKVKIKQMYLEYDEDFGVWANCTFVDKNGNDLDTVEPRKYFKMRGCNPSPTGPRPEMIVPGQNMPIKE